MKSPIRRFAALAASTLIIASTTATIFLAMAHDQSHFGPKICATPYVAGDEVPFLGLTQLSAN